MNIRDFDPSHDECGSGSFLLFFLYDAYTIRFGL